MGWFQNFVNNSPHLFGEDSDFSESDSEDEGNDEIEENQEAENDQFSGTDLFICKSHSHKTTLHLCTDCPTRK